MSFALSTEKVEKVVNAPRNPVVSPVLNQPGYGATKNMEVESPSNRDPTMFTVAVPIGIPM